MSLTSSKMIQFQVIGMTCEHCVQAVTKALLAVPNVHRAVVDLQTGSVRVEGNPEQSGIRKAVKEAGYDII